MNINRKKIQSKHGQNAKANKHSLLQKVKKTQSLTIAYFNSHSFTLQTRELVSQAWYAHYNIIKRFYFYFLFIIKILGALPHQGRH